MSSMTLRLPDDLDPAVRAAAADAGLSINAYIVRTLRREAVRDGARALKAAGFTAAHLCGEGDTLKGAS
jgi:hypothetical protein